MGPLGPLRRPSHRESGLFCHVLGHRRVSRGDGRGAGTHELHQGQTLALTPRGVDDEAGSPDECSHGLIGKVALHHDHPTGEGAQPTEHMPHDAEAHQCIEVHDLDDQGRVRMLAMRLDEGHQGVLPALAAVVGIGDRRVHDTLEREDLLLDLRQRNCLVQHGAVSQPDGPRIQYPSRDRPRPGVRSLPIRQWCVGVPQRRRQRYHRVVVAHAPAHRIGGVPGMGDRAAGSRQGQAPVVGGLAAPRFIGDGVVLPGEHRDRPTGQVRADAMRGQEQQPHVVGL